MRPAMRLSSVTIAALLLLLLSLPASATGEAGLAAPPPGVTVEVPVASPAAPAPAPAAAAPAPATGEILVAAPAPAPAAPAPAPAAPAPAATAHAAKPEEHGGGHAAVEFPAWSAAFFVGMLLSIALFPLFAPSFWSRRYGLVSLAFGLPAALYLLTKSPILLVHSMHEYVSFIILIGSLFVISGGIVIRIGDPGAPGLNTILLAIGTFLASFIGTTGASMVLIRPLLRANAWRNHKVHVFIFFIFLVSNCGGLLTPLGDPPLFLGFLRGVPFLWTFSLLPEWAVVCGGLLAIFFAVDTLYFRREDRSVYQKVFDAMPEKALSMSGSVNFLFLALVIAAFFIPAQVQEKTYVAREAVMVLAALLSLAFTSKALRIENGFTWHPIEEVAILFAAIFASMVPVLEMLRLHGGEFGLAQPWHFFWVTGMLSSVLDNAPTYLVFMTTGTAVAQQLGITADLVAGCPNLFLKAISCGAVFMGALTYIGNGPNFMVKSICEENGVKMPSFFGYMAWSYAILVPFFILCTFLFFA